MSSNSIAKIIRYALRWIPDEPYIQMNYFAHFHRFANLKKPETFNEKLNWLKLHDRNPAYIKWVDKYEVKKIMADMIGEEYIIPILGVWEHFEEIDFDRLPNRFVLKCTHDSEGIAIVKDKASMDMSAVRKKLENAMRTNFFYIGREWPYKGVKPRFIAEPYLEDQTDGELRDYKFFCFQGEPRAMYVASGRGENRTKFDFFDMSFNRLEVRQKYPNSETVRKPASFQKMIELSKVISKGFSHVRVDFYEVDQKLFFGELTFYHLSGFVPFKPEKWDWVLGKWLKLPEEQEDV